MSTLAVINLILAVVVIAAYVFIIALAKTASRADELLERMHEQEPPPGSVQAALDELGAEAEAAWPVASVESVWPRRKRGGGWVSS